MNKNKKCINCGADYDLHHYESQRCPKGGYEAPLDKPQEWENTFYDPTPYAVVLFNGDRSVGISSRQYTIQLPFDPADEESVREDFRMKIKELYEYLDNDERATVIFGDETQND